MCCVYARKQQVEQSDAMLTSGEGVVREEEGVVRVGWEEGKMVTQVEVGMVTQEAVGMVGLEEVVKVG